MTKLYLVAEATTEKNTCRVVAYAFYSIESQTSPVRTIVDIAEFDVTQTSFQYVTDLLSMRNDDAELLFLDDVLSDIPAKAQDMLSISECLEAEFNSKQREIEYDADGYSECHSFGH